jgi:hypothetical protein
MQVGRDSGQFIRVMPSDLCLESIFQVQVEDLDSFLSTSHRSDPPL